MSTLFNYPRRQSSEDFMEYERSKESNCYGDLEEEEERSILEMSIARALKSFCVCFAIASSTLSHSRIQKPL